MPGLIMLQSIGGFDITDATSLPDDGIVLLERRFRYSEGGEDAHPPHQREGVEAWRPYRGRGPA